MIVTPYLGAPQPPPRAPDGTLRGNAVVTGGGFARVRDRIEGIEKVVAPWRPRGEAPTPRPVPPRRPKAEKPATKAPAAAVEIFLPGEDIPGQAAERASAAGRPASLVAPAAGTPLAAYGSAAGLRHDAAALGRLFDISA